MSAELTPIKPFEVKNCEFLFSENRALLLPFSVHSYFPKTVHSCCHFQYTLIFRKLCILVAIFCAFLFPENYALLFAVYTLNEQSGITLH